MADERVLELQGCTASKDGALHAIANRARYPVSMVTEASGCLKCGKMGHLQPASVRVWRRTVIQSELEV